MKLLEKKRFSAGYLINVPKESYHFLGTCAADFSFAQLAKGKKFRP
jgi:hypothetical protein